MPQLKKENVQIGWAPMPGGDIITVIFPGLMLRSVYWSKIFLRISFSA
jgi:hypothetical protein